MLQKLLRAAAVLLGALLLAACTGLAGEPEVVATLRPMPTTRPAAAAQPIAIDLAQGERIFAESCTRCHGIGGAGDGELVLNGSIPEMVDFTDPQSIAGRTPAEYFDIITNGRLEKLMPPWSGSLSEAERWAVTMYSYSLAYTPELLAAGEQIWATQCLACHGPDGRGQNNVPALGALTELNEAALQALIANGRGPMPAFAQLDAQALRAVAAYARSLTWRSPLAVDRVEAPPPAATEDPSASAALTPAARMPSELIGTVSGRVIAGTAGMELPLESAATLHIFNMQGGEQTLSTLVDSSGAYTFSDVPLRHGQAYVVAVQTNEGLFVSETSYAMPGDTALALDVVVYETTADPAVIRLEDVAFQLDAGETSVQVVQLMKFVNTSDRIYVQPSGLGVPPHSLVFTLPDGARLASAGNDLNRFSLSEDGRLLFDTWPLVPGEEHIVHLVYTWPLLEQGTLRQPFDYAYAGDAGIEVFANADRIAIVADGLRAESEMTFNNQRYVSYRVPAPASAGSTLDLNITLRPPQAATSAAAPSSNATLALVFIAAGIGSLGLAGVLYLRSSRHPQSAAAPAASRAQIQALMQQIASLDEEHEAGKIAADTYEAKRSALKTELARLMKAEAVSTMPKKGSRKQGKKK